MENKAEANEELLVWAGIRECEVIQWFVEPEARVEQFDKLCEVQSDKASVDVGYPPTSPRVFCCPGPGVVMIRHAVRYVAGR